VAPFIIGIFMFNREKHQDSEYRRLSIKRLGVFAAGAIVTTYGTYGMTLTENNPNTHATAFLFTGTGILSMIIATCDEKFRAPRQTLQLKDSEIEAPIITSTIPNSTIYYTDQELLERISSQSVDSKDLIAETEIYLAHYAELTKPEN